MPQLLCPSFIIFRVQVLQPPCNTLNQQFLIPNVFIYKFCEERYERKPFPPRIRPRNLITANSKTLTAKHLQIASHGIDIPIAVAGLEDQPYFYDAIHAEKGSLDFDAVEKEVVQVTQDLIKDNDNIKSILFECTDLPPYAAAVQEAVGLPVFDFSTMINYVFSALVRKRFEGFC